MVTPADGPGSNQYGTSGTPMPPAQAGRAQVADTRESAHALADPPRFRDTGGFDAAVALVGEHLGISVSAVVKDYWVTQALRAAAVANPDVLFKGGTSLSKAWQIITRFSEDIDLVLADPADEINRTQRGKAMKRVVEAAQAELGGHPIVVDASGTNNKSRHVLWTPPDGPIEAPGDIPITEGFRQAVLIEIRFKNGIDPNERRSITTILGDVLEQQGSIEGYADLAPFDVTCLHPGRTAIEKLTIFSDAHEHSIADHADRYARHYYDMYMLLGDERVIELLSDRDYFARTVEDHLVYSAEAHGQTELHRPDGGFHHLWVFNADDAQPAMSAAIDEVLGSLYYGEPDQRPTWDAIRDRVHETGDRGLL